MVAGPSLLPLASLPSVWALCLGEGHPGAREAWRRLKCPGLAPVAGGAWPLPMAPLAAPEVSRPGTHSWREGPISGGHGEQVYRGCTQPRQNREAESVAVGKRRSASDRQVQKLWR